MYNSVSSQLWLILLIKEHAPLADLSSIGQHLTLPWSKLLYSFNFMLFIKRLLHFCFSSVRKWWGTHVFWGKSRAFHPSSMSFSWSHFSPFPPMRCNHCHQELQGTKVPGMRWGLVADTVSYLPNVSALLFLYNRTPIFRGQCAQLLDWTMWNWLLVS